MPNSIRATFNTVIEELTAVNLKLDSLFTTLLNSGQMSDRQKLQIKEEIGQCKSAQRTLRKKRDDLMNIIFDLIENRDVEERTNMALKQLQTIEEVDLANMQIKSEKVLRNVDNKLRQDAMSATLREVWTAETFPLFSAIYNMDEDAPLGVAKYYAQLALYQNAVLTKRFREDSDIGYSIDAPVWTYDTPPDISISSIDQLAEKIATKLQKREIRYNSLLRQLSQQETKVNVQPKSVVAITMKKRRTINSGN
ncbi:hypothetical protein [Vibrio sp. Hal054]|uniref:hypothetical protein n=1 Tax=Vibrio sp. Hal054 TaxID=3035158 RepID=UPI00301DCB6C